MAVLTDQTQMALTSLLTLLKENHPVPNYSSLPWTGKALLSKDCFRPTKAVVSSSIDDSDDDMSNHYVSENSSGDETEAVSSGTEEEEDSLLESDNAEKSSSEEDSEKSLGEDIPASQTNTNKKKRKKRPFPLPAPRILEGFGTYVHFGFESALLGKSPGLYYKNAELIMFASIYKQNPEYIHSEMRDKVINIELNNESNLN